MNANHLIEFQPTHRGTLLSLPRRSLGKARIFGWLPIAFSLFPILFAVTWIASIFPMMFQRAPVGMGGVNIFLVAFSAAGLVPMWFGLKILALGIAILMDQTHTSVEVTNENLICYESFYGFSFKRKIPSQPIKQLVINQMIDPPGLDDSDIDSESIHTVKASDFLRQFFPDDLRVLATTKKMGTGILIAYPSQILSEAATPIGEELDHIQFQLPSSRDVDDTQTDDSNARVTIIDISNEAEQQPTGYKTSSLQPVPPISSPGPTEGSLPAEPPGNSLLKVSHQDGTDVYEVPPQGWGRTQSGLAVFWNGFMLFATLIIILGKPQNPLANVWEIVGLVAFAVVFWAIGIGLAIWAWNSAKRSAMIGISGEQMFIETKSIFRTKWVEFNQSEVHSISVQNSNVSVNDVPVKHLVIETSNQPPLGLFANLTNEELRWLAGSLKHSLNFKWKNRLDISTAFDNDGAIIAPAKTRVVIGQRVGRTTIEVPRQTLGKQLVSLFLFALALAFVVGVFYFPAQRLDFGILIFLTLFGGTFAAIMLACFLYGARRWTIAATPDYLTVTRRWPLGKNELTFDRDDIKKICIGTNGFKTGNQHHHQLVVHTYQKKKAITLMGGWSVNELKYVAATIYDAMNLEPTAVE